MARVIKRGDIWLVDLEPVLHRELHKKRPALIISNNVVAQETPHVIIIPTSSQVPKPVRIEMVPVGEKEGLKKPSILLPIFIKSIDQRRLIKRVGKVSQGKLKEVEEAIRVVLDFDSQSP